MRSFTKLVLFSVLSVVGAVVLWGFSGVLCVRYDGLIDKTLLLYNTRNLDAAFRLSDVLSKQGVTAAVGMGVRVAAKDKDGPRNIELAYSISTKSILGRWLGPFYLRSEMDSDRYNTVTKWIDEVVTLGTYYVYWPTANSDSENLLLLEKKSFLPFSKRQSLKDFPEGVDQYWKAMYLATLVDITKDELEMAEQIFARKVNASLLFPIYQERAVIAHFLSLSFEDTIDGNSELSMFWKNKAAEWGWVED